MPVVENGRLCGIISIGDVVKHRVAEIEAEHAGHARVYRDRLSLSADARRVAHQLEEVGQDALGRLLAELDAFLGAVELEQPDPATASARS